MSHTKVITVLLVTYFSASPMAYAQESKTESVDYLERAYPNGDAYFLVGNFKESHNQALAFLENSKKLSRFGFRVIFNLHATLADVLEAVKNPRTSLLTLTTHGNENGEIYDANDLILPDEIFITDFLRPRFVILISCHGKQVKERYVPVNQAHQTFAAYSNVGLLDAKIPARWLGSEGFINDVHNVLGPFQPKCQDLMEQKV